MRYLALAFLLVGAAAVAQADTKPADKPVTVPFELLKSGHMAVEVKVNGKGPYLLIFDTGAPTSLLSTRVGKEAKILKGPPATMPGFGSIGEAKIKTLEVGGQKAEDVTAIVMDHPTVQLLAQRLDKKIEGIVGFPFFARFKMTLDYEKKTMTLVPSGYKPQDIMSALTMVMFSGSGKKALAPAAQWGMLTSKEVGDEEEGVDVKSVVPGSATDKAGLKRGDRVLTIDGRWTDTMPDLYEAASYVEAGTAVPVRIKRAGKAMEVQVTPSKGL